jgi:threonine dehydratase
MITEYYKKGITDFVISSSGNAALSAIITVQTRNKNKPPKPLSLQVFVSQTIETKKLEKLQKTITDPHITIQQVERPKQTCFQLEQTGTVKFLRQSTDEVALRGYIELAKELARIENLNAVFIPTSSGTTLQGLSLGFHQSGITPELHAVQTTSCHPLADALAESKKEIYPAISPEISLATAIVDKVAHRRKEVVKAITESKGSAWIITNEEIKQAIDIVKQTTDIILSPTSALSVAALTKALKNKHIFTGAVVCLITGN